MADKSSACIVATHATDIQGPPDALVRYLQGRMEWLIVVKFPLVDTDIIRPSYIVFHRGQIVEEYTSTKPLQISTKTYLVDLYRTVAWTKRLVARFNIKPVFVGCNNLLALAGLTLRALHYVTKVVFYAIDYSDRRFAQPTLNAVYHAIDTWVANRSNSVWSNTERTRRVRTRQGVHLIRNILVPNGVFLEDIPTDVVVHDGRFVAMEYHGTLSETKGLQSVLEALATIPYTNFSLDIIGSGPFEEQLRRQVADHPHKERIHFLGRLNNREVVIRLPHYDLSLALMGTTEDYVRYCDPMKVKEALACGVPVIVSSIPEIAETVERQQLGLVVHEPNNSQTIAAVLQSVLATPHFLDSYRANSRRLRHQWSWIVIYDRAWSLLGVSWE